MRIYSFLSTAKVALPAVLCLSVCAPVFTSCSDDDIVDVVNDLVSLDNEYSKDATIITGVWNVTGTLRVTGNAVLTIEPGTVINFANADSRIEVLDNAALNMVGTADKPITLTSTTLSKGAWGNVTIESTNKKNVFKYVNFVNGGSKETSADAVVYVNNGRLTMENCLVEGTLTNGIVANEAYLDSFADNTVTNCDGYPVVLRSNIQNSLPNVASSNTFLLNGKNAIRLEYYASEIKKDVTIHKQIIPYSAEAFKVSEKTLTIEPGVTINFDKDGTIEVSDNGKLSAKGTLEAPIILTNQDESSEYWDGIEIKSNTENTLQYVYVTNAGGYDTDYWGAVRIEGGRASIENCVINKSMTNGVALSSAKLLKFEGNTISGSGKYPLYFTDEIKEALPNLGTNIYVNNTEQYIRLATYTEHIATDMTIRKQSIPYYFNNIYVENSKTVTIEAGAQFVFDHDGDFVVWENGKLVSKGTATEPIVFTSLLKDDYWQGITIESNREDAAVFENCQVSRVGTEDERGMRAAFYVNDRGDLKLTNVTISDCAYYGFEFANEYAETMKFSQSGVTFKNCKKGNIFYGNSETVKTVFEAKYPLAK